MKKGFKAILTLLFVAAFLFGVMPAKAEAAADNTAYLSYADSSWTYQYWGDDVDTGVVATNADITGPGQYTVGLDFTGTEAGKATGMAFSAVQIKSGESTLPGYILRVDKIVVNGSEINFAKGYTNDEEGNIRINLYNEWVSSLPENARTSDGDLSDATPTPVDTADFAEVETVTVTFTVFDADGDTGAGAADDAEEAAPKTGVTSMALIYGLGALVTGAYVFKKKER